MSPGTETAFWMDTRTRLTLGEIAESCGIGEDVVQELVEYGALTPAGARPSEWVFTAECVMSVRKAARLCNDLELETSAMALVVSFLERIHELEAQVRRLRSQAGGGI
jgi:chaperone modulatory protein CbpM